jgi:hypothetical protein
MSSSKTSFNGLFDAKELQKAVIGGKFFSLFIQKPNLVFESRTLSK